MPMAGSPVWRLPKPAITSISRACCLSSRPLPQNSSPTVFIKTYVTAREREHAKAMERYYNDIVRNTSKSSPSEGGPKPTEDDTHSKTDREKIVEKARIVFGSRLAGPAQRRRELNDASKRIAGVLVPPRPDEPDNCCMSGCVNCVWDRYRDELEEWAEKSAEARNALQKQRRHEQSERAKTGAAVEQPRRERDKSDVPDHVATSMDDDGGGSETLWTGNNADQLPDTRTSTYDDLFSDIPVGIREFMRTEKRLREQKQKDKKQKQKAAA